MTAEPDAGTARLDAFLAAAAAAPAATLVALDFDGTLAPIVADPAESRPLPGAVDVLAALGAAGVTVAIVTGRAPDVAARLAGLTDAAAAGLSSLVVHGHYGLQTWSRGAGLTSGADAAAVDAVDRVRAALPALLRDRHAPRGVVVEDKGVAIGVHTRQAADPQAALDALVPALVALAEREGLQTQPGRYVCEIRPRGVDKGVVVGGLIRSAAAALYAGDDLGDLPAFTALAAAGGQGTATVVLASGQQDTDPRVEAAADLTVAGPAGVLDVLRQLADRLRRPPDDTG